MEHIARAYLQTGETDRAQQIILDYVPYGWTRVNCLLEAADGETAPGWLDQALAMAESLAAHRQPDEEQQDVSIERDDEVEVTDGEVIALSFGGFPDRVLRRLVETLAAAGHYEKAERIIPHIRKEPYTFGVSKRVWYQRDAKVVLSRALALDGEMGDALQVIATLNEHEHQIALLDLIKAKLNADNLDEARELIEILPPGNAQSMAGALIADRMVESGLIVQALDDLGPVPCSDFMEKIATWRPAYALDALQIMRWVYPNLPVL